ncbi:MAG: HlyD family type I secretion periplasmic adaptor subunit [Azonexus sp.]
MQRNKSLAKRLLQRLRILLKKTLTRGRPDSQREDWESSRHIIAIGRYVIIFGFGGFLAWACLAPLDEGVVANGVVAVESKRKLVSHLSGGIVASILVKENQRVAAGDILLTLDDVQTKAALDSTLQQYVAVAARLARLRAEQVQSDSISFPDDIKAYAEHAWAREAMDAQVQLFKTRKLALANEQAILNENLSATGKNVVGTRQQLAARAQQYKLLQQEIDGLRPLVAEGYATRNQLLAQERALAELSSVNSELETTLAKGANQSGEIRLRQLQARQAFLRDVETQLAEAQRDTVNLAERLKTVREEFARSVIRAPVSGQVVALQTQTPGGIIAPGGRVLEIVPESEQLLLDVQVPPGMVSRVIVGQEADIHINAFPDLPQMVLQGRIMSVSADRHTDPQTGAPYFLGRIEVTEASLRQLAGHPLHPGMPVDVVIKTGERTFAAYLIRPLTLRLFSSLREY